MTYKTSRSILEALRHGLRTLEASGEHLTPKQTDLLQQLRQQIAEIEALSAPASGAKPPRKENAFRNP